MITEKLSMTDLCCSGLLLYVYKGIYIDYLDESGLERSCVENKTMLMSSPVQLVRLNFKKS